MAAPALSVLIATYRPEGITRVAAMDLPRTEGVEYVVSWQEHENAPVPDAVASRPDIKVHRFDLRGVSLNRNNAISHAGAPLLLMSDDDLRYTSAQLTAVIKAFAEHPEVDYASFMYDGTAGKTYPDAETDISTPPRWFYQTCFEIAVRKSPRTARLLFNPCFGPGAPYFTCGEDEIFYLTARRMGLNCRFFPITVTAHPHPSTGQRAISHPGILRTNGALIALNHPHTFWARIPVNAWRISRRGRAPLISSLAYMYAGAFTALATEGVRELAHPSHNKPEENG